MTPMKIMIMTVIMIITMTNHLDWHYTAVNDDDDDDHHCHNKRSIVVATMVQATFMFSWRSTGTPCTISVELRRKYLATF